MVAFSACMTKKALKPGRKSECHTHAQMIGKSPDVDFGTWQCCK